MNNVVNLDEIRLAKQIVTDFPNLIQKLDNCYKMLYNGADYYDIALVLQQIQDSKVTMELFLNGYTQVLEQAKEK